MKHQINHIHTLLTLIEQYRPNLLEIINMSIAGYRSVEDKTAIKWESTSTYMIFNEGKEIPVKFVTLPHEDTFYTEVSVEDKQIGHFFFEDNDFDEKGKTTPGVDDFIIEFILLETKSRLLNELFNPLLHNCNIANARAVIESSRKVAHRFGLDISIIEGSAVTTVAVILKQPYDVLGSSNVTIPAGSSNIGLIGNILIIETLKGVLFSLFDQNKLVECEPLDGALTRSSKW